MKRSSLALLLSGTALIPAAVAAQDASGDILLAPIYVQGASVFGEDSTVVAGYTATGSKTVSEIIDVPAQVSVVTQEELRTRAPDNLMQALAYTGSVSVDEYGSDNRYDFFRIRGFSANSAGTYRDGLPLRSFNFTGGKIEPYSVQRIDVLKGSTSTLFGLNGPGGLVNVITKRPQDLAFGEVYTTVGEDHAEIGTDFGAPLDADGVWTYRLTAKVKDGKEDTEFQDNDARYLAGALSWKPTAATSLTLLANWFDSDGNSGNSIPVGSTAPRDTYFGEPGFGDMDRDERSFGYEFSHDFGNGLTFRQNARQSNIEMVYKQVYLQGFTEDGLANRYAYHMDGEIDRFAIDNQLQYDTSFGNIQSRTLLGVDYTDDDLREFSRTGTAGAVDPNDPVYCGPECISLTSESLLKMKQKATGIYLQQELTFDDRWIVTLGGRHDRVETEVPTSPEQTSTQTAFTKRAGLTYKATPDLSFYANYSESFEPVSGYYNTVVSGSIKPQEGKQYEAGVKYRPGGGDALLSFALFDLTQSNVPRSDATGAITRQIGEVNVKGAEIDGRMAINDSLNVLIGYSYWDAEIIGGATGGNVPQLTPEHSASFWADYAFGEGSAVEGLRIGGGGRLLGDRFADDANTTRIGSAVVIDAMASYQLGENTEIALNVNNLFDREYIATKNFDNTANFYGDERTIRATLRKSW
ncbi:TonB-dependent siderophore receptor [Cereibacter sp. SYSU M97828]|nr:TonB-dependent siderophore receptor [Cereibacter flavus]